MLICLSINVHTTVPLYSTPIEQNANKNAFQQDAYCPLQWLSGGACLGVSAMGVSTQGRVCRGVSAQGGVYPTMHWGRHPLSWTEWQTGVKHYLAATLLRTVKLSVESFSAIAQCKGSLNVSTSNTRAKDRIFKLALMLQWLRFRWIHTSFSTLSLSINSVNFFSTSVGQLLPCAIHVSSVCMVYCSHLCLKTAHLTLDTLTMWSRNHRM